MTPIKSATLAAAVLAGLASQASAQDADAEYRRYCTGDYQRFCSDYDPYSDDVSKCFRARLRELSPKCRETIQKYGGRRR